MLQSRIEVTQLTDSPYEISVSDVKQRLDAGEPLILLDIREIREHQICRINGAQLIPMRTIPERVQEVEALADEALLVVFCHHGMRSLNTVSYLRKQGLDNCVSMAGGIEAWSTRIDPDVPRY
jgi:rhodanese-related sulfurtransferase